MKKKKSIVFFPDKITSVKIIMIFLSFNIIASEKNNFDLYEKNFKNLEMETRDHKKIKINELPSRVVILNFWASWCIPCMEEIPSLVKLAQKSKGEDLAVILINTDEENQLKNIEKIEKKYQFPSSFIIVADHKFKVADQFKFNAIPVTVIYQNGKVVFFSNGPVDFSKPLYSEKSIDITARN